MKLFERWQAILESLIAQGRYRQLALPSGVDFASNDYLGYGARWRGAGSAARSGLASRLLRGHQPIWEQVESDLARWHGAESALMMTSGYVANEGLLHTIVEPDDWVASDQFNHASLIDGLRLARAERFIYRHLDLDHLEHGLRAAARSRQPRRQLFVIAEALFGMEGDLTALEPLVCLAERYDAHVIVDEAHSTGCFGPAGSGCVDAARLRGRVLATVHTGGKALGVPGAYVCGSTQLRDLLINRCRQLIFTTALPPEVGNWWLEALARVRQDEAGRTALHEAAATMRTELARADIKPLGGHYIMPIIVGEDSLAMRAASWLRDRGWDIRAIRPPSVPEGSARLRLSIHADHTSEVIRSAAADVAQELAVCPTS